MFRLPLCRRLPSTAFHRYSTASGAQAHTPPRPPRSLARSTLFATTAALASYAVGSLYPPDIAAFIAPRTVPPPPPPDHPDAVRLVQSIEDQLHALPLVQKLRDSPDADEWYETRPYARIPEAKRVHHLTTGALRGPGKLAVAPLVRARKDETESIIFVHLGRGLCGHDGIIHGGLLATLLDESLARTAILNLPERIGVTANLSLNYRAPTRADQFVVIKTKLEDLQGRKARVSGIVEDINGTVLVEAKGMFVQPRYAKLLNSGTVRDALGAPPAEVQPKQPAKEMIPTNTSTSSAA